MERHFLFNENPEIREAGRGGVGSGGTLRDEAGRAGPGRAKRGAQCTTFRFRPPEQTK